jgi:pyruvate/2-oxoglutarate dehydrogenase complex dihydrolipoamide acyltransferase (E2) component
VAALAQSHQDALAQLAAEAQARIDLEAQLAALGVGPAPGDVREPAFIEPMPLAEAAPAGQEPPRPRPGELRQGRRAERARSRESRRRERPVRRRTPAQMVAGWVLVVVVVVFLLAIVTGLLQINVIP